MLRLFSLFSFTSSCMLPVAYVKVRPILITFRLGVSSLSSAAFIKYSALQIEKKELSLLYCSRTVEKNQQKG